MLQATGQKLEMLLLRHPTQRVIYIRTTSMPDTNNCGSSMWVKVSKSNSNKKEIYTAVVAAGTAGKKVKYHSDSCEGPYPVVNHLEIFF